MSKKKSAITMVSKVSFFDGDLVTININDAVKEIADQNGMDEEAIGTQLLEGEMIRVGATGYCIDENVLVDAVMDATPIDPSEMVSESEEVVATPETEPDVPEASSELEEVYADAGSTDDWTEDPVVASEEQIADIVDTVNTEEPLEVGDTVRSSISGLFGVIVREKKKLKVSLIDGKGKNDLTPDWSRCDQGELPETALAVVEPAEVVAQMTPEEVDELIALEKRFLEVKSAFEKAPIVMGEILRRISVGKLYRGTHETFEAYALDRFGITRQYASQLAQISGFREIAIEALDSTSGVELSVNALVAMAQNQNKVSEMLGLGKATYGVVKPIIENTMRLLVASAPLDKDGMPILTPRVIDNFNNVLVAHIKDGVVEIEGTQMTVQEAAEQGLLSTSLQAEVIATTAEQIKAQSAIIAQEAKSAYERQTAPVVGGGVSASVAFYEGKVPKMTVTCSNHGKRIISAIGNGTILLECGCRFRIDAKSNELVCFETEGKRVQL